MPQQLWPPEDVDDTTAEPDPEEARDNAYRRMVEEGRQGDLEERVFEAIDEHGPGTCREIFEAADPDMYYSTFQPRCTKFLPEKGVVMAIEQRQCRESGQENVTVWDTVK